MDVFWISQSIVSLILVLLCGFLLLVSIIKLISLFKAARLSDLPDLYPANQVLHNTHHHSGTSSVGSPFSVGQDTPSSGPSRDSELGTCPLDRPVTSHSVPRSTSARTVSGITRSGAAVASQKVGRGHSVHGPQLSARPGPSQASEQSRQPDTQFKSHSDIFEVELLEAHERGRTPDEFKHFLTR